MIEWKNHYNQYFDSIFNACYYDLKGKPTSYKKYWYLKETISYVNVEFIWKLSGSKSMSQSSECNGEGWRTPIPFKFVYIVFYAHFYVKSK